MRMRLKGVSFIDNEIIFAAPQEIMEKLIWKGGFAKIDLSEISDIAKQPSVQADAQDSCNLIIHRGFKKAGDKYCRYCGKDLRTA